MPSLSLVVVAFDMSREIVRTVRSLSPPQQGIAAAEYELVVVDNGSSEPIDREACEAFGANIRWLRIEDAPASPAMAVNRGLVMADAPLVGVMVDGARMASPGLIRHALAAARVSPRPVIGTFSFHLGPGLQQRTVAAGYDQAAEDALLSSIDWERDGYELFGISVPAASSAGGWFDLPAESNALFLPGRLWKELGGYDERFETPGGGFVNLDTFRRACDLADTTLIMLFGEGTFHQVHGGISTNEGEPERTQLRMETFHAEYARIRQRPFSQSTRRPLLFGTPSRQVVAAMVTPAGVARRYTDLLKQALLDEVGRGIDGDQQKAGRGHTRIGRQRLDHLDRCVSTVLAERVPGDLVECGAWRSGAAILMRGILAARQVSDRSVWIADASIGASEAESPLDVVDVSGEARSGLDGPQERFSANFARFGLMDEQVRVLPGRFRDTLPTAPITSIALLRLDGDMYEPTMSGLTALYGRLSLGGFVIVGDYGESESCRRAVDDFRSAHAITEPIEMIDRTGACWRKRRDADRKAEKRSRRGILRRRGAGRSRPDRDQS
ncbi:MAG TPA: TylF/MycF/NovP-related O-methyltransferase [Solirubrobacteraceae bacterium]|nr:TylF/MycF/NovP-related O-methyltransferase [Solirubrobacteraceae bacterium]